MQKSEQLDRHQTPGLPAPRFTLPLLAAALLALAVGPASAQVNFLPLADIPANDVPANVSQPQSVRLADFNGDGILDMVVGYSSAGATNIMVRYGTGGGAFGAPLFVKTALNPRKVIVGDANGDGHPDIFAACQAGNAAAFIINAVGFGFVPYQAYVPGVGYGPRDVAIVDLNSDGTNDFVTVNFNNNSLSVYLGNGDETFTKAGDIAVGNQPVAIVAEDFNQDGRVDLAVANSGDNSISILLGYQNGTFATAFTSPAGGGSTPVELAVDDFDKDGYPDLLVVKTVSSLVIGMRNNEFGFLTPTLSLGVFEPAGIKVADLNADGTNDFIIGLYGSSSNKIRYFQGQAGGYTSASDFVVGLSPAALDVGDVDGDGVPDLVVANDADGTISVLLNRTPVARSFSVTLDEDMLGGTNIVLLGTTNMPGLNYNVIVDPTNGIVLQAAQPSPEANYEPGPDFYGKVFFDYTVDDGSITSAPARVYITVQPVNDAPFFDASGNISVSEDWRVGGINYYGFNLSSGPSNERGQAWRFYVYNSDPSLFLTQPYMLVGGKLMFTPAKDANGSAVLDIVMEDTGGVARGGENRFTNTVLLTIDPVNDAPTFTFVSNRVNVVEDAGPVTIAGFANISVGPFDEEFIEMQSVGNFTIVNNSNPGLFVSGPEINTTGDLSFTTAPSSNGTAYITVQVADDGGTFNGGKDTSVNKIFIISVVAVNNPPYFELDSGLAATQVILEDSTNMVVSNFVNLASISVGPPNEIQAYYWVVQNSNPGLFMTQPTIRKADGALLYRPRLNSNGIATVNVILRDTGPITYGGDNSYTNSFTITVNPVNDAPSATYGRYINVFEDCGPVTTNWFKNIKTGPTEFNESTQSVAFVVFDVSAPGLFSVQPAVAPNGDVSFTPAPNANGQADLLVNMYDSGPSGGPGDNNVAQYKFSIKVAAVNDQPSLTLTSTLIFAAYDAGVVRTNVLTTFPGAFNESNQLVSIQIVNTNSAIFSRRPVIYPSGLMEFAPANNLSAINKEVTLAIRAVDNGGISYGGINTNAWITNLTIRITP